MRGRSLFVSICFVPICVVAVWGAQEVWPTFEHPTDDNRVLAGPHSFKMSDGAVISCDGPEPGQAVSFIAQKIAKGVLTTTIVGQKNGAETVAVINNAPNGDFIYSHWENPTAQQSAPLMIEGTYDRNGDTYVIRYIPPSGETPVLASWQEEWKLAQNVCIGLVPAQATRTLIPRGPGAYPADSLDEIDTKLPYVGVFNVALSRSDAEKALGLRAYGFDALTLR